MGLKDLYRKGARRVTVAGGLPAVDQRIDHVHEVLRDHAERMAALEHRQIGLAADLETLTRLVERLQATIVEHDPEQAMVFVKAVREQVQQLTIAVGEQRAVLAE